MLFQQIEHQQAVVVSNGTYQQVDLYARGSQLFAKHGSGYVRLYADGSTSKPKLRLDTLTIPAHMMRKSELGKLRYSTNAGEEIHVDEAGHIVNKLIAPDKSLPKSIAGPK